MAPLTLLRWVGGKASQSRILARRLFWIDFPPLERGSRYFDVTTPVLVSAAAPALRPGKRLLDMGTGAFAVIGLALWRRTGCDVVATDVRADLVLKARRNVEANGAPIRVVEARFFDGLEGGFDCVTFNCPYVPSSLVCAPDVQSDGGPDGTTVVAGFLDAFAERGGHATAFLGINRLLVPRPKVTDLIDGRPGLVLQRIARHWASPADVYVVARK